MKAIFIPTGGYPDLTQFNIELKDCKEIVKDIQTENGCILILDYATRKEKLEKINKLNE